MMEPNQPEPTGDGFAAGPLSEFFSKFVEHVPNPRAQEEWKQSCAFPLTEEVVAMLRERQDSLAEFAGMTAEEIVKVLRNRFVFQDHPFLTEFSAALLSVRLSHLTLMKSFSPQNSSGTSYPGDTSSYLSFSHGDILFHIPCGRSVSGNFRESYPFEKVPGLLEFFENFGGMVVGGIPPGPCFAPPAQQILVNRNDPGRNWGDIGDWEDSLVWYKGGTGDRIIFHPDGTAGVWCHEGVWNDEGGEIDEQQTWPVGKSFPELLVELRKYLLEEADDENPFYY